MKILILGHKGYLGSYLHQYIDSDVLIGRDVYDNGQQYDCIINCIGKVSLEYCESNPDQSYKSNVQVVKDIITNYPNTKIINFSSYYVYNDSGLCTESSKTTNKYIYNKHKLESERIVTEASGLTFRIGKLFGSLAKSRFPKLTEYILNENNITLDNVLFNPTSVSQVLKVINSCNQLTGVYNLSNSGTCTHYEYGMTINNLLGNTKNINKVNKIKRTFTNYGKFAMCTKKVSNYINLTPWEEDLKCIVSEI